ncbi:protein of unknown function DUF302, partial [Mycolicibacterium rhodesiae JS60]
PPEASNVVQYLVGNHLFAEEMYREDQSVMLYAPLRAAIYQDADGKTHFVIDQPSTVFDSFDNPVIEATGNQIDEKLADLLTVLGAPAPNELNHPAPPAPASTPPAATPTPAASPDPITSLLRALRGLGRAFFNHNPAINYDPTSNSQGPGGVITGDLQVTDAEGDPISYAVTDGPDSGTVTVATDGTFTYTPSEALASTGGTDSFTVTVSDETGPLHVHGLLGLLGGGPAHATTMQINVSVAAPQAGVNVIGNNVNRLDIIVNQSYSDFRAAFEAAVPTMSQDVLNVILAGQPNYEALVAATNANAPYGFIRYGSIPPFSLMLSAGFGYPPEASNVVQYLVGNHLFAEEMYREDQSVMLYAPLRAAIYQDADGKTHFVIDQPSTVFDSFDNPVIEATGNQIDEKLADLLTVLGA